jgi:hypothetical protein
MDAFSELTEGREPLTYPGYSGAINKLMIEISFILW